MHNPKRYAAMFAATFIGFVVLDAAYLTLVGFRMFQNQVGWILRPEPMLGAAIAFYLIYTLGLVVLAVEPARSFAAAAAKGAVLGLTAYATFDLTNLAVIKGWTIELAATDITWGAVASAMASMVGYAAGSRFSPNLVQTLVGEL